MDVIAYSFVFCFVCFCVFYRCFENFVSFYENTSVFLLLSISDQVKRDFFDSTKKLEICPSPIELILRTLFVEEVETHIPFHEA